MKWNSLKDCLPDFDEETQILCLMMDEQKGFWFPKSYPDLIEKGWWIPQREIFIVDGVEDAIHLISHWMLLPPPPSKVLP